MSSPGGGMSYGDDYVAARLSIDIPEGSVEGIREITQAVEAFRVSMDATNHLVSEFSTYLKEMGEASKATNQYQKNLLQTMAAFNQLTGRYGGVPGVPPSGVPGGPSQAPFGSQGQDSPSSPSRPFSPSDVGFQVAQDAQKNQIEQMNQQHARGALTAQDVINISPQSIQAIAQAIADRDQAGREQALHTQEATDPEQRMGGGGGGGASVQQRVNRATSLAGRISNEVGPGGSMLGMAGLMVQGIEYMHRASAQVATRKPTGAHSPADTSAPEQAQTGEPGGGSSPAGTLPDATVPQVPGGGGGAPGALSLMSLASSLKPIAGIATIMLGAAAGVQMVGGAIQGMRNVASVRGGAGGEGLEATMRSKILAMNPFISQDQARQIYQSVMGEGYADASGGGADNVVMFMSDNMTKMNISVADSAKMLRTTIVGKGGEGDKDSVNGAIETLRTELDTIRTLSRQSVISTPDYVKAVASLQEAMVASGASPGMAGAQAMLAEEVGSQSQVNKGQFAKGVGDMQSSAAGGALLRTFGGANVPAGLMTSMVPGYLEEHGQLTQSAWNVMRHFAQMYARQDDGSEVQRRNAVGRFMRIVKSVMPDHQAANNYAAAKDLYLSLLENTEMGAAEGRVGAQPSVGTPDTAQEALPSAAFSPNRAVPDMAPPAGGGGGGGGGSSSPAYAPPAAAAPVASQQNVSVGLTPEASKLLTVLGNSNPPQVPGSNKQAAYRGQSTTNSAAPGEE